jgi:hypothetical protein
MKKSITVVAQEIFPILSADPKPPSKHKIYGQQIFGDQFVGIKEGFRTYKSCAKNKGIRGTFVLIKLLRTTLLSIVRDKNFNS